MVDLQNPYAYEASLNNILHKVPFERETGVELVAITLLNDILSHLCKWPGLSAEDISKFTKKYVNEKCYRFTEMLTLSVPDVMILGDLVKDIPLYAVIEVKDLDKDPDNDVFTDTGAISLIQELKNESDIKDIIKEILYEGYGLGTGRSKLLTNKWEVKVLSSSGTDGAFPLEIRDDLKVLVATLHQLDTYLLECYLDDREEGKDKGVIWTNGLCWKIWTKDASGNIIKNLPIKLDQAHLGCVKNNNVQIDPIRFRYLIDKLISFLSTLSPFPSSSFPSYTFFSD